MFKITGLNHVGIAVVNLDEAVSIFHDKFGLPVSAITDFPSTGLKMGILSTGNSILELMEPLDKNGSVAKFLERQGRNAVHHIAFSVDTELYEVALELRGLGVEMVSPEPTIGVLGHPINFCHPKFTGNILVELCEVNSRPT
jgi:methylmalonyl-CoA/ethylmalonyl-CoA epimerase